MSNQVQASSAGDVLQVPGDFDSIRPPLDELTLLPTKADAYARETWAREAWAEVARATDPLALVHHHALLVIKPEAMAARVAPRILDALAAQKFTPVAVGTVDFDRHLMRALWAFRLNIATVERLRLQELLQTSCRNVVLVLRDMSPQLTLPASVRLTAFKGPAKLESRRPEHLRTGLGVQNRLLSYVHTTDEPADLLRELGVFFAPFELRQVVREMLAASDKLEQAREVVRAIELEVSPHDLRLETALAGITARAAEAALEADNGERSAWHRLAQLCDSSPAAEGDPTLWAQIESLMTALNRWDVVVTGAHLVQQDVPGVPTLVGDADAASWHDRLQKV